MELKITDLQVGLDLPEIRKQVTQEDVNRYANASGDFNPIHIDEEFARKTPAGGTIAHGMLILAYVSQMMTAVFGEKWLTGGRFNVRFKTPARPGDVVTVRGKVEKVQESGGQLTVNCSVLCSNQKSEAVITGEAIVRIPVEG
ncbi:MAG: MaoC family dehydratase [Dehalococcoidales bacterium]|nr:MaoC family dehydratase [Dehalococcoidales bacterium]